MHHQQELYFWVISINHQKTPLSLRNRFAFTPTQIENVYKQYRPETTASYVLLSTCNRTELYGRHEAQILAFIEMLVQHSGLSIDEVRSYVLILSNEEAIKHLFRVSSGLESQILGDYEIVGQIKSAFMCAKAYNTLDGLSEKIYNFALAVSKKIKNQTKISDGTTSVSFLTAQLLKQFLNFDEKSYCLTLLGLGTIGLNTLKNLQTQTPKLSIYLVNRNNQKAEALAKEYKVRFVPFESRFEAFEKSDILIVATSASVPIVLPQDVEKSPIHYIFDLSIPSNVDENIKKISSIHTVNIDELSGLVDQTFQKRKAEVPFALTLIENAYKEFEIWRVRRQNLHQSS